MITDSALNPNPSGTNVTTRPFSKAGQGSHSAYSNWWFRWGIFADENPEPTDVGQVDYFSLLRRISDLQKLERQHRERVAAVMLDEDAQKLLCALDQETSIRWEDLLEKTESDWGVASRSAAVLVGANLCEASPTRIRLNEYGDKLLAESLTTGEARAEIAS